MAEHRQYIALLRGINVGGNNRVSMSKLREMLSGLGYENAQTLIQSGNAVFECADRPTLELEAEIEAAMVATFGRKIAIMVRTAAEWHAMVGANPFVEEAKAEGNRVFVHCLKSAPDEAEVAAFDSGYAGSERLVAGAREVYVYYPGGIGRSELRAKFLVGGTARNWNTVVKLEAMLALTP